MHHSVVLYALNDEGYVVSASENAESIFGSAIEGMRFAHLLHPASLLDWQHYWQRDAHNKRFEGHLAPRQHS